MPSPNEGHPIREFAKERGISVLEVGRRAGLAQPANIFRYMNGTRSPSLEMRRKLSKMSRGAIPLSFWGK